MLTYLGKLFNNFLSVLHDVTVCIFTSMSPPQIIFTSKTAPPFPRWLKTTEGKRAFSSICDCPECQYLLEFINGTLPYSKGPSQVNGPNGSYTGKDDVDRSLSTIAAGSNVYGNYAGSDIQGKGFTQMPIDELDSAAQQHDKAYTQPLNIVGSLKADLKLMRDALKEGSTSGNVVATGMALKMLADLSAGQSSFAPKHVQFKKRGKMPQQANSIYRSSGQYRTGPLNKPDINGPNGSYTAKDDVKKNRNNKTLSKAEKALTKAAKTVAKSAGRKSASAAARRATDEMKVVEKMARNPKGGVPFTSAMLPTQMTEEYSIETFFKPIASPPGQAWFDICAKIAVANVDGFADTGTVAENTVIFARTIDKTMFIGTILEKQFTQYEKFQLINPSYSYLTLLGTGTQGQFKYFVNPDPHDPYTEGQALDDSTVDIFKPKTFVIYKMVRRLDAHRTRTNRLWTDKDEITYVSYPTTQSSSTSVNGLAGSSISDPRFTSAGTLVLVAGTGIPFSYNQCGTVYMRTQVRFSIPTIDNLSSHIYTSRVVAGANQVLASFNQTSLLNHNPLYFLAPPPGTQSSNSQIASLQQGGGQMEYAYNPTYYNNNSGEGGSLNLPPGDYSINGQYHWAMAGSSITNTTFNMGFPSGIQYSGNFIASTDTNEVPSSPYCEFLNTPVSPATLAITWVLNINGRFRIPTSTYVSANTYVALNPQLSQTLTYIGTGNMNLISAYFEVRRLESLNNYGLASLFPYGTSLALDLGQVVKDLRQLRKITDSDDEKVSIDRKIIELQYAINAPQRKQANFLRSRLKVVVPQVERNISFLDDFHHVEEMKESHNEIKIPETPSLPVKQESRWFLGTPPKSLTRSG